MDDKTRNIILGVVILFVAGAIGYVELNKKDRPRSFDDEPTEVHVDIMSFGEKAEQYEVAKEISTPDGFINVDSITVADQIGKNIVLIDFWTYSCINCQRTLPYLNAWHDKYADMGLVILGVHTPEFGFEEKYDNVLRAVEKFDIEYPVILDNDYSTWTAYKNRYWPRKYLIDIDGFIVYDHIGEGSYDETEAKIVSLLNERNQRLGESNVSVNEAPPDNVDQVDFSKVGSPEMYLGSDRIEYIYNLATTDCFGSICDFSSSGGVPLNSFSLDGSWEIREEEAILRNSGGSIFVHFSANKVNLVAGADSPVVAEIYIDGERVGSGSAGADIKGGVVTFDTEDLYNIIDFGGNYGEHTLEIRVLDEGLSAFAFTFG